MEILTTVLLWGLGLLCLGVGGLKVVLSPQRLAASPSFAWVEREGIPRTRLAGATEVLASMAFIGTAVGVGFLEDGILAGLAAIGVAAQMGIATFAVHGPHGESTTPNVTIALVALALAAMLFLA